ncbi:hypothetical protein C7S18_11730 [Ahniella affigens]|uniref:Outer membrane lipoprotein carrier protein LolA n=2 Tax=Ahniella affigens TaxID=2021234 RepID=A0A2P1PSL3_9GAMM|nr:hypothetical protein C7S18_11730 [Ahniella affigens]
MLVLLLGLSVSSPVRADDAGVRAELISLWSKMLASKDLAYRAHMVTTDKKGRKFESTMAVQWPNRFHMKNPDSEMIILPQGTWMNAGGNWMKMPMDMSKMIQQYTPDAIKAGMDGIRAVSFLGESDVNGKNCKQYRYDFDSKVMGIRSTGTATISLDASTGFPVRMETTGEAMGQKSSTVVDYEYDPTIRITAPN